eukprot:2332177-Rhodomonas_salina.1
MSCAWRCVGAMCSEHEQERGTDASSPPSQANLKPNETNPFVYDHTQPIQTPPPPAAPKQ